MHPNASPLERAFHKADAEWWQRLREKFGDLANVARYQKRGEGEEGSELRLAYNTFCFARDMWLEEVERENRDLRAQLANAKLRAEHMIDRAARYQGEAA